MFRNRLAVLILLGAVAGPVAAQTPPSPPAAPAAGDAAQVLTVLDRFCVPAVGGTPANKLAPALGIRTNRDGDLVLALSGSNRITITPPDVSNPKVCILTVLYDVGADGPIFDALNGWALARKVPYTPGKVHESSVAGDQTIVSSTWEGTEADGEEGLVFSQARTADGKPLTAGADQATVIFSVQPK
jgi:hypothetical protein